MDIQSSRTKRNDKHLAVELRKRGLSYAKISRDLNIPKSTLSGWLGSLSWSQAIKTDLTRRANYVARKRLRLVNKKRRIMWEEWREAARQEARNEYPKLATNQLFIAGIMLYWGEGDSKIENCQVRLTNTNPNVIKIFTIFLEKICTIPREKIKISLFLYPDLIDNDCHTFWSDVSGIPISQFQKTQVIQGRHPTKRLAHGICTVGLASRQLKEKIFVWINLFSEEILKNNLPDYK